MENKEFVKDLTKMEDDFAKWYTDIVLKAELVDYAPIKGFMVIRPYGYALWENIQNVLDTEFKKLGHKNCYFPALIPESLLNKEKEHVEGFAPEVAWVTHGGDKELEEKLCFRPTSETIICTMYARWLHSYRELPFKYNQWANVVRWEKTTRPFLRTSEFLWQEGHTIHETPEEAMEETLQMHKVYADFLRNYMAMPVIMGEKSEKERFAGAERTYTVEAMMHDGKALQAGTSHYLGQHFSKAFDITFQGRDGKIENPYQTSWGVSTRMIGGLIMTHGDNRGLKMPPRIAPIQVVIVPIAQQKEGVLEKVETLRETLAKKYRVEADTRSEVTPGFKFNHWELRGVPVRIEIGPKDIEANQCIIFRRDTLEKETISLDTLDEKLEVLMEDIQNNMLKMAEENLEQRTFYAHDFEEYKKLFAEREGFAKIMWCGDRACEDKVKEENSTTFRCIPFEEDRFQDVCTICGKKAKHMIYAARQY